jgi:hypothetical protein
MADIMVSTSFWLLYSAAACLYFHPDGLSSSFFWNGALITVKPWFIGYDKHKKTSTDHEKWRKHNVYLYH